MVKAQDRGDWSQRRNSGPGAARDPRPTDEPSYTIRAQGSGSHPSGTEGELRMNTRQRTRRVLEEPSVALTSKPGHWEPHYIASTMPNAAKCKTSEPAPTVAFGHDAASVRWSQERPATTVQGDSRIWPPGHKVNADDERRLGTEEARKKYGDRAGTDSVRVTVQEAATLQGFPPDYPWQGTKSAQYRQVGDAMPPAAGLACPPGALRVARPALSRNGAPVR